MYLRLVPSVREMKPLPIVHGLLGVRGVDSVCLSVHMKGPRQGRNKERNTFKLRWGKTTACLERIQETNWDKYMQKAVL